MHKEILSETQLQLFPVLRGARRRGFYLVWETAIALHLGHRESIDFDLFRAKNFSSNTVHAILCNAKVSWQVLHIHEEGQYTWVIQDVKNHFFLLSISHRNTDRHWRGYKDTRSPYSCSHEGLCNGEKSKVERLCRSLFYYSRSLHYSNNLRTCEEYIPCLSVSAIHRTTRIS